MVPRAFFVCSFWLESGRPPKLREAYANAGKVGWGHTFYYLRPTKQPESNRMCYQMLANLGRLFGGAYVCGPCHNFDRPFELFGGVCDWILNCVGNL